MKRPTSSPYRIAIGRIWQETNTFAENTTGLKEFRQYTYLSGVEMLPGFREAGDELTGFADILDPLEVEYIPIINAFTWCGGPLQSEVVEDMDRRITSALDGAGPLNAVLFSLHGALACPETPDVEGHSLSLIRQLVGPEVPIIATFDHHANITREIMTSVNALTAYRHCPHIDLRETGQRGAQLCLRILEENLQPTMAWVKIPVLTPCEHFRTAEGPMHKWFSLAREREKEPGVLDISQFPVQPWLDVPELGWTVAVTTDGDSDQATSMASELANHAWQNRRLFYKTKMEPAAAVAQASTHPQGPVVLADGADATNAGSPGDSTCLLLEMISQKIVCKALLTMVDPEVVEIASQAGEDAEIEVSLGAKRSRRYHKPAEVRAKVIRFSDGRFFVSGHAASVVAMGRCVLLEIGSIRVVVSEFAGPGHDPMVYRQIGEEPLDAQIVVVKATVGHTDAFRDIMKLNLEVECPGPSPSYLDRLEYQHAPRPLFPFEENMSWAVPHP